MLACGLQTPAQVFVARQAVWDGIHGHHFGDDLALPDFVGLELRIGACLGCGKAALRFCLVLILECFDLRVLLCGVGHGRFDEAYADE